MVSVQDSARIDEAIRAAQARTSARIECVLARASANYDVLPMVAAALIALAAPWPILILSEWSAERIYLAQLVIFLVALGVLAPLRVALFPARRRRALAHRAALEQFTVRGLSRGPARNGALIYVSLAERYARIIADDGAAGAIPQHQWQGIVDALLKDMRAGSPADALIAAAERCADALAEHYPPGETARPGSHFHVV